MRAIEAIKIVKVPKEVELKVEGRKVEVKGKKGMLIRDFSNAPVEIKVEGEAIVIRAIWPRKKEAALVGTVASHLKNMIMGVTKGFTYKLKVVFSHFPISVKVQGKAVLIENFLGERSPRVAEVVGGAKVIVKGDEVLVQGIDIEEVSQTAANIEHAVKVKRKDPRVFLDGIYVYERSEGME